MCACACVCVCVCVTETQRPRQRQRPGEGEGEGDVGCVVSDPKVVLLSEGQNVVLVGALPPPPKRIRNSFPPQVRKPLSPKGKRSGTVGINRFTNPIM